MKRKILTKKQYLKRNNSINNIYFCVTEKGLKAITEPEDYDLRVLGNYMFERLERIKQAYDNGILTEGFYVVIPNGKFTSSKQHCI